MASRFETVRAREGLKARHAPYWTRIRKGCYLGFRKTTATAKGTWLARYRDQETGKQVVESLGHLDDVTSAERFDAARARADDWFLHKGLGGTNTSRTLRQACEDYVTHLRAAGRHATARDAAARFRRWVYDDVKLSQTPLLKLTPRTLDDWRKRLAATNAIHQDKSKQTGRPRSSSSLNRDMTCLRAALNLALENGHVTSDRTWKVKLRPVKDADRRRDVYLDHSQRRALISNAPADLAALLRGLSMVPLRPGALAALNVGHFDARLATLAVGKDKSGRDRKIPLPESTAAFFAEQAHGKAPGDPLICRADGSRWNKDAWKIPIKVAATAAQLPPGTVAYALRHSAITDLIALQRLDTMTVAQLAGTSLMMIERNYGHLLREHARTALAGLAL
jgi:integrase